MQNIYKYVKPLAEHKYVFQARTLKVLSIYTQRVRKLHLLIKILWLICLIFFIDYLMISR